MRKPFGVDQDKRVEVPDGLKSEGVDGGGGIFNEYFNQALFETQADHIWGNQLQVTVDPATATFYTDSSGNPLDASASAVTINDDDKILIRHDSTQSANLLLDASGKRISIEMYGGITLNMSTYNLTLGGTGDEVSGSVDLIGTGTLTVEKSNGLRVAHTAMTISNLDGDITINNGTNFQAEFSTKNLIIDVQSSTTVDVDSDNIVFIDKYGKTIRNDNVDTTFNITTDLMSGTSEKSSTWYQLWMDNDGVRLMVPDLDGTADSNVTTELRDSGATFQTDLVQAGDVVFNLTDLTQGVVVSVDSETAITLNADVFPDGNEDYKIRMLSPTGIGGHNARLGAAYNNSSSNLDDSTYTIIQGEKLYSESAGDFTVTSNPAVSSMVGATVFVRQTNDWTGIGTWKINYNIQYNVASASRAQCIATLSGIAFKTGVDQAATASCVASSGFIVQQYAQGNAGNIYVNHNPGASTKYAFSGDVYLNSKPTFHS